MRIGLLRPSSLGDVVQTMVVIDAVAKHCPHAKLEWIIDETLAPLLDHHPNITYQRVLSKKLSREVKKSLGALTRLYGDLKALPYYDVLIDFSGGIKSALYGKWIAHGKLIGYDRASLKEKPAAWLYDQVHSCDFYDNVYKRALILASEALGMQLDWRHYLMHKSAYLFSDPSHVSEALKERICPTRPNVLLVIGASKPQKIYPYESFAEVAKSLDANVIVLWGNDQEFADAKALQSLCPKVRITPKLSLNELKFLASKIDLLIGNDTGPSHFAFACNKPSVLLFGNTPPSRIVYETPINTFVKSSSKVDAIRIDHNDFSIRDIEVQTIVQKAKILLDMQ